MQARPSVLLTNQNRSSKTLSTLLSSGYLCIHVGRSRLFHGVNVVSDGLSVYIHR